MLRGEIRKILFRPVSRGGASPFPTATACAPNHRARSGPTGQQRLHLCRSDGVSWAPHRGRNLHVICELKTVGVTVHCNTCWIGNALLPTELPPVCSARALVCVSRLRVNIGAHRHPARTDILPHMGLRLASACGSCYGPAAALAGLWLRFRRRLPAGPVPARLRARRDGLASRMRPAVVRRAPQVVGGCWANQSGHRLACPHRPVQ